MPADWSRRRYCSAVAAAVVVTLAWDIQPAVEVADSSHVDQQVPNSQEDMLPDTEQHLQVDKVHLCQHLDLDNLQLVDIRDAAEGTQAAVADIQDLQEDIQG